jgi:hypothetical protein
VQVGRVAGVAALVDRGRGRQGGDDAVGVAEVVAGEAVLGGNDCVRRRVAAAQRVGRREGGRISRVLEEAVLAVEAADIDGDAGPGEESGDPEGEDDEDLAALQARRIGLHQLMTIVTSPVRTIRPLPSRGSSAEINGITRSWW